MGTDRKAIKTSIQSVNAMLHMTRAMGLVASSKIRRANERMQAGRQYAAAFTRAIQLLAGSAECRGSVYFEDRPAARVRLIVIAGDRGLAGGYNNNIFRTVASLTEDPAAGADFEIIPIGRRACDKYHAEPVSSEHYAPADAAALIDAQCADYSDGRFDRLAIVSTKYVSVLTQTPKVDWVLPLNLSSGGDSGGVLFEPDERTVLDSAVPGYLTGLLCAAVRESFACEAASRRNAMDSAGKNAQSMIDDLTLAYNRARQSAITQEITEIVAGSER